MIDVADLRLLVGAYTATSGGHATGLEFVEGTTVTTAAVVDDPSFLAVTDDRVYVVSETLGGGVHAFRRRGTALEHLWSAASGGDAPCHVVVDPSGTVIVANYTSGTVSAVSVETAESHAAAVLSGLAGHEHGDEIRSLLPGSASATYALPEVVGSIADRQEGPHAHQSVPTPEGTILVSDLGGDALHELRVTNAPSLELVAVHPVGIGVGPRHMVWFDGDLIVSGELDGAVHRLRRGDDGAFAEVAQAAALEGDVGESLLSHIEVGPNGLVYVAVRGRNTIAVFDASNGGLTRIGVASCGGNWPRHFAFVDGAVVVANQLSDELAVLPIGADGIPGAPLATIPIGSPTCVVPLA